MFAPERNILAIRIATIGQMQPFDPVNDRISTYLERVQLFFQANGIADNKNVPALLSIIGGGTTAKEEQGNVVFAVHYTVKAV